MKKDIDQQAGADLIKAAMSKPKPMAAMLMEKGDGWDEEKHPRDKDGKFGSGGGGDSTSGGGSGEQKQVDDEQVAEAAYLMQEILDDNPEYDRDDVISEMADRTGMPSDILDEIYSNTFDDDVTGGWEAADKDAADASVNATTPKAHDEAARLHDVAAEVAPTDKERGWHKEQAQHHKNKSNELIARAK